MLKPLVSSVDFLPYYEIGDIVIDDELLMVINITVMPNAQCYYICLTETNTKKIKEYDLLNKKLLYKKGDVKLQLYIFNRGITEDIFNIALTEEYDYYYDKEFNEFIASVMF